MEETLAAQQDRADGGEHSAAGRGQPVEEGGEHRSEGGGEHGAEDGEHRAEGGDPGVEEGEQGADGREHRELPVELSVEVRSVAGELLKLALPPGAAVVDLQRALEESWDVPVLCQRLLVGSTVLGGAEKLADSCPGGERALEVTMLVTLDRAIVSLQDDEDEEGMAEAFRSLSQLGERGGEEALAAVMACLRDGMPGHSAQRAGLQALARLAPPGHRLAARLAVWGVGSDSQEVRLAAMHTLNQIAESIDEGIINGVANHLEDRNYHVRCAANEVLVRLASRAAAAGRATALEAAGARLLHGDAGVRQAAGSALRAMVDRGDEQAISLALHALESEDGGARASALEVLAQVCGQGEARAVAAAASLLEDGEEVVRSAAVKALRQAAGQGDERALAEARSRLAHPRDCVRQAAVKALGQLGRRGHEGLLAEIAAMLEDSAWAVRQAVVEALGLLAERGSPQLCWDVWSRFDSGREGVRQAAVEAFAQVAPIGDAEAIDALGAMLEDSQFGVRGAAVKALRQVARKGDERAMAAARARLAHSKEDVRKAASQALAAMGARNTLSTIAAVAGHAPVDYQPSIAASPGPTSSAPALGASPGVLRSHLPGGGRLRVPAPAGGLRSPAPQAPGMRPLVGGVTGGRLPWRAH